MVSAYSRTGIYFTALFFACLFFQTHHADAALLYFDPPEAQVYRGDTVTVALRLDTDVDECINTVNAVVHYDPSISAVDVSRGSSILSIWVENPIIDEKAHTITFVGGIPGGYCGRISGDPSLTNVLLELIFRSPGFNVGGSNNSSARIWIDEQAQILLHDGYGTNANVRLQDARIELLSKAGDTSTDAWKDKVNDDENLPSDFPIILTRDDVAFSGKYFITFNAIDKQSGIDHYEVMEEPFSEFMAFKWGRADAPWIRTESPYVLKDQTLNSTIRIKAIDKAGNERIGFLVPDEALRSMSRDMLITVLVFGGAIVGLCALFVYALWKRKQRLLKEIDL